MFAKHNNRYNLTHTDPKSLVKRLEAGVYIMGQTPMGGIFFRSFYPETDGLVQLHGSVTEKILKEVDKFFEDGTEMKYKRYGLMHKRNILMYGPPGTGKSCTIYKLMESLVERDIVMLTNLDIDWAPTAIDHVRHADPGRKVVIFWEDCEREANHNEHEVLEFLDGPNSRDNTMVIATTNHIDSIPSRIKNRPSRFAPAIKVGYPQSEERRAFLESKIHEEDLDRIDIDKWVKCTENMSLDHVKDLIVSVLCLDIDIDIAAENLRKINAKEF